MQILTIRTVTTFLQLQASDFPKVVDDLPSSALQTKINKYGSFLRRMEQELSSAGYVIQTLRIATNPFGEWLVDDGDDSIPSSSDDSSSLVDERLKLLDKALSANDITFCSLGPARTVPELSLCSKIVASSGKFSCSFVVDSGDVESALHAADMILTISTLGDASNAPAFVQKGLGNFRFCAAASCKPYIPFFPAAKAASSTDVSGEAGGGVKFAIGLENGQAVRKLLGQCQSIQRIRPEFCNAMAELLQPVQALCEKVAAEQGAEYLGIDSSFNPSLEDNGSIAEAIEQLHEIPAGFGGPGTLGAAAEITQALQSLPGIKLTGYCGLMLPVCEDQRLADLASNPDKEGNRLLRITDLLSISSVCGVGVDTVPIPGDCTREQLSALILDVAGIAGRWNKSLSCRVFPVPGKKAGEFTEFDSPYMVNARIFEME